MSQRDRRLGYRIPYSTILTSYVDERAVRLLAEDLSDTGMRVHAVSPRAPSPGQVIAVEVALPDDADTIWATAAVCHRRADDLATGMGVRFVAMATRSARRLRDYCVEARRAHLGGLLERIRTGLPA
ncbi:MAG: PilZ domain-containing protein [Kofleriaceae bacterium]|jgi:c-di-GMP-binding flagellar brake protein YcgR|nr:PilZ domain-containing protein [Kofleriaceae bacterium]MBP9170413.1 PilZ domain-containing protein [Kofleriaceae bacterium]MBP9860668.1 PilZ domain-containing protein [Kofleriaceae bacterium]